jgi:hypothetical protein
LGRAVAEVIDVEYPDPPEHVEHSRRLVGIAALLVCPESLLVLGEFGRWEWRSKPDPTWDADATNPNDDFWREMSRPPDHDGPHKPPLNVLHARHQGREEVLFQRMPGEQRKIQSRWGDLSRFCGLLHVAVNELESEVATALINALMEWGDHPDSAPLTEAMLEIAIVAGRQWGADIGPLLLWQERVNDPTMPRRGLALLRMLREAAESSDPTAYVREARRQFEQVDFHEGQTKRGSDPLAVPPSDPAPAAADVIVPDGFYSPTDIAKAMRAPEKADAIRMALKRLFDDNRLPDGAWMENSNPAKGQAKILFRLSAVRPLLARFEPPRAP